jgi:hypothetical protein
MEFYTKFRELYNVAKSNENTIEIKDEEWKEFNKKLSSYTLESLENIYKVILHYHYIENKKNDMFPYGLKRYHDSEGITFEPRNLPLSLQYIILKY